MTQRLIDNYATSLFVFGCGNHEMLITPDIDANVTDLLGMYLTCLSMSNCYTT